MKLHRSSGSSDQLDRVTQPPPSRLPITTQFGSPMRQTNTNTATDQQRPTRSLFDMEPSQPQAAGRSRNDQSPTRLTNVPQTRGDQPQVSRSVFAVDLASIRANASSPNFSFRPAATVTAGSQAQTGQQRSALLRNHAADVKQAVAHPAVKAPVFLKKSPRETQLSGVDDKRGTLADRKAAAMKSGRWNTRAPATPTAATGAVRRSSSNAPNLTLAAASAKKSAIKTQRTLQQQKRKSSDSVFGTVRSPPQQQQQRQLKMDRYLTPTTTKTTAFTSTTTTAKPPPQSPTIISPALRNEVANELRALIGRRCDSPYDKYTLLEERDKILRKLQPKISDVRRARAFVGTCEDMCPEKERYQRIVQKRMSSFEYDANNQVQHALCIKDYSRSSADQEEPLPHELRPAAVLVRTTNYLLYKIANRLPEAKEELSAWYDFLWNRTRAIRKDITQQMINDQTAVHLVECCARLHIFAAYYLCELDRSMFDQKMNTENLVKSLQTLRHLYEDLSKKGVHCENEAEFRSYDILLNLTDANILRQVLTYPEAVRRSPLVRLAVKLVTTNQNKNYVRFFKMVTAETNCLQLCIVHRHFPDIRRQALDIMCRSAKGAQYPLDSLTRILAFNNNADTLEFCAHVGIRPSMDSGRTVVLDKGAGDATEPGVSLLTRCDSLMKVKLSRYANVGELLSGQSTFVEPTIDVRQPACSFDANNCYVNDPVIARFLDASQQSLQRVTDTVQIPATGSSSFTAPSSSTEETSPFSKSAQRYLRDHTKLVLQMAERFFPDWTDPLVSEIAFRTLAEERVVNRLWSSLFTDVCANVVVRAKQIEKFAERQQRIEKQRELVNLLSTTALHELVTTHLDNHTKQLAAREWRAVKHQQQQKVIEAKATVLCDEFLECFVDWWSGQVINTVHEHDVVMTRKRLLVIKARLQMAGVRRCFNKWRRVTKSRNDLRRVMLEFPSVPGRSLDGATTSLGESDLRRYAVVDTHFSKDHVFDKLLEARYNPTHLTDAYFHAYYGGQVGVGKFHHLQALRHARLYRKYGLRWLHTTRQRRYRRLVMDEFPATCCLTAAVDEDDDVLRQQQTGLSASKRPRYSDGGFPPKVDWEQLRRSVESAAEPTDVKDVVVYEADTKPPRLKLHKTELELTADKLSHDVETLLAKMESDDRWLDQILAERTT